MAKYVFPAVFTWSKEDNTYYVKFPDVESAFTDGETITEAIENADDVLNLMLYSMEDEGLEIPKPTDIKDIPVPADGFVNLIMADTVAYQEVIDRENNPIKYAMNKAGLNIKKVSDLLGAPYRTVQEWKAGRRMPPEWCQRLIIKEIETNS